ncbi:hypothetical protein DSCO28_54270 [Desulfosarcina ovata subsp. sediminis]|uniref:RNA polymerase sigma-70 region 3 domain-containing protein n=1 Tax=Desulfosarcina ovata subsp. sediminis TaxID=885957 RepID=A0A5K7ZXL7_9BACT|nr:sigma-70 domain-containing protein [Desulfosarcina ovata]BBO84861.1 hypothetical protein DSCO28_54270 [Desulfosarcina ovata subsp. sediminis]
MAEDYFETFWSLTKVFSMSQADGEPDNSTAIEVRRYRLLALIKQVRRMAIRKFYQMPDFFTASHELDDWIQEAFIIMFECCEDYDHRGPFDHHVRFMVSRRLISLQRKIFRENPPVNSTLFKIVQELKQGLKREPTADEIAEHIGRPVKEIETMMADGFNLRMVVDGVDIGGRISNNPESSLSYSIDKPIDSGPAESRAGISAESQMIRQEARRILMNCIEKLLPESRLLFIRHEFEGISFGKIYKRLTIKNISLATFKRRYQSDVFNPVKECVISQYQIQS